MSKAQHINQDSIVAFGLFGLFFGGPVPHYFYRYIPYFVKNPLAILAVERLLYTPCFQGLALYMIARFEVQMQKKKKNVIIESNRFFLRMYAKFMFCRKHYFRSDVLRCKKRKKKIFLLPPKEAS